MPYFNTTDGTKIRYLHIVPKSDHKLDKHFVILPGRSSFIENYAETISQLSTRGYDVWILDWRGQGGSQRFIDHPQKNHTHDFELFVHDLHEFIKLYIQPVTSNIVLFGISLGAHIGFRYLQIHQASIVRAIFIAPMFDVNLSPFSRYILRPLLYLLYALKIKELYVPGYGDHCFYTNEELIYDPDRYETLKQSCYKNHQYLTGGPTIAWAKAMFKSITCLKKHSNQALTLPIFVALAGNDIVVDNQIAKDITTKLSNAMLMVYPKANHNILLGSDAILEIFWQDVDKFMSLIV
jgi:lysophospholipase